MKRQQVQHCHLAGESLGRSNTDLGAGMSQHGTVRLAREHRTLHVTDREDFRALFPRLAHSRKRVGSLTRLRDCDHQGLVIDNRIAIPELRSVIDLDRNPRQFLEHVLAGHRCVQAGPTCDRFD